MGSSRLAGPKERIVAHAAFVRVDEDRAEVAFEIADELQGRGLGTILYAHLAEAAEERGITMFEAEVLPENNRMLEVFRDSGFPITTRSEPGVVLRGVSHLAFDRGGRAFRAT